MPWGGRNCRLVGANLNWSEANLQWYRSAQTVRASRCGWVRGNGLGFRLNDPAVNAMRRQVRGLVKKPNTLPLIEHAT